MISVQERAKSAAVWIVAGNFANRVLGMASMIVAARLLVPDDFGIVALATAAWGLFSTVFAAGIEAAVIHHQKQEAEFLDTAFWLNALVVGCLVGITAALSPLVESYYDMEGVGNVIVVIALGFSFNGIMSVHMAVVKRELSFKTPAVLEFLFQLLDSGLVIILALAGAGYWSLVLPKALLGPFRAGAWYAAYRWVPGFALSREHARSIAKYSANMMGASFMQYVNINADYLIAGKMLGQTKLGLYQFAYDKAQWPVYNIVWPVANIGLPYFARIKDDREKLAEHYFKTIELISLAAFPMLAGLIVAAPELIPLVFGEQWAPSVFPFQALCVFGMFRSVGSPGGRLFLALGRPDVIFKFNLGLAPVLVTSIFLGARHDIEGVAVAGSLTLSLATVVYVMLSMRALKKGMADIGRRVAPSLFCAAIMASSLEIFRVFHYAYSDSSLLFLCLAVPLGALVFSVSLWALFRRVFMDLVSFVRSTLSAFWASRKDSIFVNADGEKNEPETKEESHD